MCRATVKRKNDNNKKIIVRTKKMGNNVSAYKVGLLVGVGYAFRWNCRDDAVALWFPIWYYVVCSAGSIREDSITNFFLFFFINNNKRTFAARRSVCRVQWYAGCYT